MRQFSMAAFLHPGIAETGKLPAFSPDPIVKTLTRQEYLALREGAVVLEHDHCGDKVLHLADGTILKLFRRKRLLSSATFYPYARRFANNARALERLGIPVPHILASFRIPSIERDAVRYAPLAGSTLRELSRAGIATEQRAHLKDALTRLIVDLHDKGVYFRSLHIGNIVCTPEGQLGLIDFSDLRIHPWPLGRYLRARNIRRMASIADEADWLDGEAIVSAHRPSAEARNG